MCVIINAVSSFEIITFERMLFLILSKAAHISSILAVTQTRLFQNQGRYFIFVLDVPQYQDSGLEDFWTPTQLYASVSTSRSTT